MEEITKRIKRVSAGEVARHLGLPLTGSDIELCGVSTLDNLKSSTLVFANKYADAIAERLNERGDVCVLVGEAYSGKLAVPHIVSPNPRLSFMRVVSQFYGSERTVEEEIHPTAVVEPGAKIGKGVRIGAHCFVGREAAIGDESELYPNVTLTGRVVIGRRCVLKSGCVIGQQGFGFERDEHGVLVQFPHIGGVRIGDDVQIGANTAVDCGTIDDTEIGEGSKIDNLVHVAHNCHIGKGSLIIAGTVLCGGVEIGEGCWVAPNASIREHLTVGDNAVVGLGSVVVKSIKNGETVIGNPAKPLNKKV